MLAFIRRLESTYERVVSAADGLRGASRTTSNTNGSDGGAGEPDETLNVGEDEAEQTTELAERGGACLQGGRGVVVSTKCESASEEVSPSGWSYNIGAHHCCTGSRWRRRVQRGRRWGGG